MYLSEDESLVEDEVYWKKNLLIHKKIDEKSLTLESLLIQRAY